MNRQTRWNGRGLPFLLYAQRDGPVYTCRPKEVGGRVRGAWSKAWPGSTSVCTLGRRRKSQMAVRKWQGQDHPATCDAGFRYIPGLQVVDPGKKWESNRCKPQRTTSSWAFPSLSLDRVKRSRLAVDTEMGWRMGYYLPCAWPVDVTRPGWTS